MVAMMSVARQLPVFPLEGLDGCRWKQISVGLHVLEDILISTSHREPVFQHLREREKECVCVRSFFMEWVVTEFKKHTVLL